MKSASRRELINRIKELQHQVNFMRYDLETEMLRAKEAMDRLAYVGAMTEYEHVSGIQTVEVKPVPYGQYAVISDATQFERVIDEVKSRLVSNLARGLMESGMVQFVCQGDTPYNPLSTRVTIGAKLYVVPWDKTVIGLKYAPPEIKVK